VPPSAKPVGPTTKCNLPQLHLIITTNSHCTVANITTDCTDNSMCSAGMQPNQNRHIVHICCTNSFHYGKITLPLHSQRFATSFTMDYPNSNTVITHPLTTATLPCKQPGAPQPDSNEQPCRTHYYLPNKAPVFPTSNSSTNQTEPINDEMTEI